MESFKSMIWMLSCAKHVHLIVKCHFHFVKIISCIQQDLSKNAIVDNTLEKRLLIDEAKTSAKQVLLWISMTLKLPFRGRRGQCKTIAEVQQDVLEQSKEVLWAHTSVVSRCKNRCKAAGYKISHIENDRKSYNTPGTMPHSPVAE